MDNSTKKALQQAALKIRLGILEEVFSASSGHPGGSLSIADILSYLFFKEMRIDPKNPQWEDRDRFVLSKGHTAPALYAALANRGYFEVSELKGFRNASSFLQGHPDMKHTPGVDMTTGSLGLGISAACGMALSGKISDKDYRVYAVLGDGETEEGQVWEAAMFAGNHHLDNLTAFVDYNGLQIDGTIDEVNSAYPIAEKFAAFKWNTIEIDGHDFDAIKKAVDDAKACKGMPTAVIMKTVKGKGVSYMENAVNWHGAAPNEELYNKAMDELKSALAELEA